MVFSQVKPYYRYISGVNFFKADDSGFGPLFLNHVYWTKAVRLIFCPLNKRKTFIPITVLISGIISSELSKRILHRNRSAHKKENK